MVNMADYQHLFARDTESTAVAAVALEVNSPFILVPQLKVASSRMAEDRDRLRRRLRDLG
jgi:hypothetical protein